MPEILLNSLINGEPTRCYDQFKGEFKAPYTCGQMMNAELNLQIG